ncbi:MAG: ABC transporter substrate-binding protein [Armatimonadota bacterium]
MMRSLLFVVAVLLAALVAAVPSGVHAQAPAPSVLRVAMQVDPSILDPARSNDPTGSAILFNVYTPLVEVDARGRVQPLAAKSWSISSDGLTYRFVLRDGLQFQSGARVTAEDVKYTLDRLANPNTKSPHAKLLLSPIEGFEEVDAGRAASLRGVRAVSPTEVEIKVDRPHEGDVLVRLAHLATSIVSRQSVEQGGENWGTTHANGTGAFRLVEWVLRGRITLAANPSYFGGAPKIGRIVFELVPDPNVGVAKYEAGELDLVQVPISEYQRLKRDARFGREVVEYNRASTTYLALNQKAFPAFKDVRVRRAVAHAIDKPKILRAIFLDLFEAASGILPPGFPGYDEPLAAIPYDPSRARALLVEAGFPQGRGLPAFVLGPNPRGFGPREVGEVLGAMIGQNLGIQTQVQLLDIARWRTDLAKGDVFSPVTGYTAGLADPNYYLYGMFHSKSPSNYFTGYSNPAYDRLVDAANRERTQSATFRKLREAERWLMLDEVGVVPIYHNREIILRKPYVRDMQFTPFGLGFIERLRAASIAR